MTIKENIDLSTFPSLEESYDLTKEQIESYQEKGHILLRNVATPDEMDIYEPIISHWVRELNYHDKPVEERIPMGRSSSR